MKRDRKWFSKQSEEERNEENEALKRIIGKEGRDPLNGSCFRALLLLPQRTLGRNKKPQSRPRVTNYAKGMLPRKKGSEKWAILNIIRWHGLLLNMAMESIYLI